MCGSSIFVGHILWSIATVAEEMLNREASYGLEVLYVFHLYGPKAYTDKTKELIGTTFAIY